MENNGRSLAGKFAPGHRGFKKAGLPEFQRETRAKLWSFFEEKISQLPSIFDKMSPNNQARVLLSVAEFFSPKPKELLIEANIENHGAQIDYTKLSDSTLKEIIAATTINDDET